MLVQALHHNAGGLAPNFALSHVNGRWRTVALDMPLLWADIQITPCSNVAALRESILRSRNGDLNISIFCLPKSQRTSTHRFRNFTNIRDALLLLTPLASLWHRLSISGDSKLMKDTMPLILALRLHRLRCLELIHTGTSHTPHFGPFTFNPSIFTSLRLHGVTIHVSDRAHFSGLVSLDIGRISCCMIDQASADSLSHVNAPIHPPTMLLLRHLSIQVAIPSYPLHPSFHPASLISLKFGGFRASSLASIPSLVHVFNTISSPNLRHLELDAIVGSAWDAFIQSLQATVIPKYPGLDTLTLRSLELRNMDSNFASAFPALKRLILVTVDPRPLHALLRNDRSIWPTLTVSIDSSGSSI
ncbi:hypothetical protein FPV67DRAFT_302090 [Lyophyllum atratum]|nr:hypothetical protein FPV67DRAFT_302090 [Lyophyllum atratum]